jgi:diacylglycerol kinase
MGIIEQFAEYGILGLIIAGLLYVIWYGLKKFESIVETFNNKIESIVNTFSDDFKQLQQEHREDRKDWHESFEHRSDLDKQSQERRDSALKESLDGLKEAIIMQNNRRRDTD